MICVRAPELETRLEALTKATGITKSSVVRAALEIFLPEQENDSLSLKSSQKNCSERLFGDVQKKKSDYSWLDTNSPSE